MAHTLTHMHTHTNCFISRPFSFAIEKFYVEIKQPRGEATSSQIVLCNKSTHRERHKGFSRIVLVHPFMNVICHSGTDSF